MIVEYVIHSGIRNYTKLAFNSLKMIPNNTVSQPIRQGMIGLYDANNNNNNVLARVIKQYNDQYKKHSNSITVPNGVVAIC